MFGRSILNINRSSDRQMCAINKNKTSMDICKRLTKIKRQYKNFETCGATTKNMCAITNICKRLNAVLDFFQIDSK